MAEETMDDGSWGANPWLFSDGEGPSGLASYDPNGSAPPTDWRTGNYHPFNTFVEQRRENVRSDIDQQGIARYLDDEEISFTFWHMCWRLRPDYPGPLPVILFNYQSYEESRSMGDRHSWGARHAESGDLISHTPQLTEDLVSPFLYAMAARGDVRIVPYPAYDPRGGTNEEPNNAKMAAYKKKKGTDWRPKQGVVTPEQQSIVLKSYFSNLVRPVLEKFKGIIKLVVPKSALPEFLRGMGHSDISEFEQEFPGVLVAIPPHTCVLYNKQFAANANFNTNCRNAEREWTNARRAISGNPDYPPCDLSSMMDDESSEEYQRRVRMQLESCAMGGRKSALEYERLRALGDLRTLEEEEKFVNWHDGRGNGYDWSKEVSPPLAFRFGLYICSSGDGKEDKLLTDFMAEHEDRSQKPWAELKKSIPWASNDTFKRR